MQQASCHYDWVSESTSYLGATSILSPPVTVNVFHEDPHEVCGYLCHTNAPNHATRGVCAKYTVKEYQIESPIDTLFR